MRADFVEMLRRIAAELGITIDLGHDYTEQTIDFTTTFDWSAQVPEPGCQSGTCVLRVVHHLNMPLATSEADLRKKLEDLVEEAVEGIAVASAQELFRRHPGAQETAEFVTRMLWPDLEPEERSELADKVLNIIRLHEARIEDLASNP